MSKHDPEHDDLIWIEPEEQQKATTETTATEPRASTRRTIVKRLAMLGAAGTVIGLGVTGGSQPAVALESKSLTASDLSLKSNSGRVENVWLKPDLTYSWDGLDSQPTEMALTVAVDSPDTVGENTTNFSNMSTLDSYVDETVSGLEGSGSHTWENQLSLLGPTGPWTTGDFRPSSGGRSDTSKTTGPIEIAVRGALTTTNGETFTNIERAKFDVKVTNEGVSFGGGNGGGVGGTAGTGGSPNSTGS